MSSIEELFAANIAATEKLILAVEANTVALLGAPATTPVKTTKEKPAKATPAPKVEPETPVTEEPEVVTPEVVTPEVVTPETPVTQDPEPATEPEVQPTPFPKDKAEGLALLAEKVKEAFTNAGPGGLQKKKDTYMTLREKWGVEKASELADDKLEEFYNEVVAALA